MSSSRIASQPNQKQNQISKKPPLLKIWVAAARPHTLTASVSPVLVGHHLCNSFYGAESLGLLTLQWLLFCMLVQLGTNLHNDYADFVKGADTDERVGHARATQKGWLTPEQTCRGSDICLTLALTIGLGLTKIKDSWDWFFVAVVLTSVFNAVAYTGGPYPLGYIGLSRLSIGYSGLGDAFVFLYFGLVATLAVPYLYLRQVHEGASLRYLLGVLRPALSIVLPVGWLGTAIIVVNNLRDRHTDVVAGKRTLAVRFGATFCRVEYALLVLGSYMFLPLARERWSYYQWLPLFSLPLAIPQLSAVSLGSKGGSDLNVHVGGTAQLQLAFCVLLSVGLSIDSRRL